MARVKFAHLNNFVVVTSTTISSPFTEGVYHAGIAFATGPTTIGQFINSFLLLHEVLAGEDMIDHVEFLPI
jgi:hypothetical protein